MEGLLRKYIKTACFFILISATVFTVVHDTRGEDRCSPGSEAFNKMLLVFPAEVVNKWYREDLNCDTCPTPSIDPQTGYYIIENNLNDVSRPTRELVSTMWGQIKDLGVLAGKGILNGGELLFCAAKDIVERDPNFSNYKTTKNTKLKSIKDDFIKVISPDDFAGTLNQFCREQVALIHEAKGKAEYVTNDEHALYSLLPLKQGLKGCMSTGFRVPSETLAILNNFNIKTNDLKASKLTTSEILSRWMRYQPLAPEFSKAEESAVGDFLENQIVYRMAREMASLLKDQASVMWCLPSPMRAMVEARIAGSLLNPFGFFRLIAAIPGFRLVSHALKYSKYAKGESAKEYAAFTLNLLKDTEIRKAILAIKRKEEQKKTLDAIFEAHLIGRDKVGKGGEIAQAQKYTTTQIKEKTAKLKETPLSDKIRKKILQRGYAGDDARGVVAGLLERHKKVLSIDGNAERFYPVNSSGKKDVLASLQERFGKLREIVEDLEVLEARKKTLVEALKVASANEKRQIEVALANLDADIGLFKSVRDGKYYAEAMDELAKKNNIASESSKKLTQENLGGKQLPLPQEKNPKIPKSFAQIGAEPEIDWIHRIFRRTFPNLKIQNTTDVSKSYHAFIKKLDKKSFFPKRPRSTDPALSRQNPAFCEYGDFLRLYSDKSFGSAEYYFIESRTFNGITRDFEFTLRDYNTGKTFKASGAEIADNMYKDVVFSKIFDDANDFFAEKIIGNSTENFQSPKIEALESAFAESGARSYIPAVLETQIVKDIKTETTPVVSSAGVSVDLQKQFQNSLNNLTTKYLNNMNALQSLDAEIDFLRKSNFFKHLLEANPERSNEVAELIHTAWLSRLKQTGGHLKMRLKVEPEVSDRVKVGSAKTAAEFFYQRFKQLNLRSVDDADCDEFTRAYFFRGQSTVDPPGPSKKAGYP